MIELLPCSPTHTRDVTTDVILGGQQAVTGGTDVTIAQYSIYSSQVGSSMTSRYIKENF